MNKPLIFDIARGSTIDGPGIRTVVFIKGCPLRCIWCHNPESQKLDEETFFYKEKCIECGNCESGCNSLARVKVGKYYTPENLVKQILRDKIFYESSSGGVTFSGGEPLIFSDYLLAVFKYLKQNNIHIAVETCGYFDYKKIESKLLEHIDLIMFDIKFFDSDKHKKYTSKPNDLIISNFKQLLNTDIDVLPRIPLVPTITATEENLSQIAKFFKHLYVEKYALLPYNTSGIDKWMRLNKLPPKALPLNPMTLAEEKKWKKYFEGIICKFGYPHKVGRD